MDNDFVLFLASVGVLVILLTRKCGVNTLNLDFGI